MALVLLYHAHIPGFSGGYIGVDVFFVLSGFLITSLLIRERETTGRISINDFYSRRIRRILPMSAMVVVATLVAARIWLEPLRLQTLGRDAIGTATFSVNFQFAQRGADYLQSSLPPSPLQHYWSLAVEEQFYVVWPVLIWLACLGARKIRTRVAVVSLVVTIASFVLCMRMMNTSQPWAFFSPHTRAFELSVGAIAAVLAPSLVERLLVLRTVLAWAGVAAVIASGVVFDDTTRFPGPWALVPVVATALAVLGGDGLVRGPQTLLRSAPFQWLGSRSYSAYLWHWPVLIIAPVAMKTELSTPQYAALLGVSLMLSELSYHIVERPVHTDKSLAGVRALALGASLIAIVLGSGLLMNNNQPALAASGVVANTPTLVTTTTVEGDTTVTSTPSNLPPRATGSLTAIEPIVASLSTTYVPSNLTPSLARAGLDEPVIYKNDCHGSFSATTTRHCVYGNKVGTTVIGLYGDSHAAQWFPGLEQAARTNGWKLIVYTKRGCPPAELPVYNMVIGKNYDECVPWRKDVLKKMRSDGVRFVVVANFDRLLSQTTRIPFWQKDWREALQGTVDVLKKNDIVPILVKDTPFIGDNIPTCLSANLSAVSKCAVTPSSGLRDDIQVVRDDLSVKNDVPVLNTRGWFCTANICPPIVGNLLVYRDDNHMSTDYSKFLAPLLSDALKKIIVWYPETETSVTATTPPSSVTLGE